MTLWPFNRLSRGQQVAVVALLAIAAGALVAPQVYAFGSGGEGTVKVVEVSGMIDSDTSQQFEDELREARHNDSVEAVVLEVDSGGGQPASSERMYTAVERTTDEMPVTAYVDSMGASGAYYAMVPADRIYVSPSSAVGSVGVTGPAPTPTGPSAGQSGPDKGSLHPEDDRAGSELIQETFIDSVMEQRGDKISLDREEVAHARTYYGVEAVGNGYADEIGTLDDAIHDAADSAGLDSYNLEFNRSESSDVGLLGLETTAGGEATIEASDDSSINPYQPQLIAPEVWHHEVAPQLPDSTVAVESGGDQQ
ncbi:signal peptide peptidase [Halostagnicola sp. A56]|uniref:S49 family peptidase n=1 Tax=Halostagnicola sp. A56 TaxID=1495067 RepID=UPI00049FBB31|nr:S49 family peptidase [Halostagnicola sp. A56]KDE59477.1 signal peptide peptidase [Halostagnicola sp. A56]